MFGNKREIVRLERNQILLESELHERCNILKSQMRATEGIVALLGIALLVIAWRMSQSPE